MAQSSDGRAPPSVLSSYRRLDWSELANEPYFDLQMVAKSLLHLLLGNRDQLANVFSGGLSQIDHDVRVNVRNLRVTVAETLQSDLIDQTPGTDTLNFLEDRAGTWVILEPWMLAAAPTEIFLHDAVHDCFVAPLEVESHRERDVPLLMECARVVAELHVVPIDRLSPAIVCQELGRLENFRDEHGPLSRWGRRKKVQVLPDRSADRARNPDVVLQTRQSALDGLRYQLCHHCSALHPEPAIVEKLQMAGSIPDDETPESLVADEDVGTESEYEILDSELTGSSDSPCQILRRCGIVEEIGWTTDLECGVLSKWLISLESRAIESSDQLPEGVRTGFPRI